MTLRRKMAIQIGAMLCAIGLLAGASIWGLLGLQRDLGSAITSYDELRELFEVGDHVASWNQSSDLLEKIRYYLERPAERQRIANAGQAHCLAHHTWQQRFSGLLDELGIRRQ